MISFVYHGGGGTCGLKVARNDAAAEYRLRSDSGVMGRDRADSGEPPCKLSESNSDVVSVPASSGCAGTCMLCCA
jgi:hypothetical protein